MSETINVIKEHQSMRNYTGRLLTQEEVASLQDAAMQTSSSCFLQEVSIIRVTDREKLEVIAQCAGGQEHIANCAEFWMFCIDYTKLQKSLNLLEEVPFKLFYSGLTDVALYCQNVLTAAESIGLGGVIIGGYKQNIDKVSELLKVPHGVIPALGLCLGVPDENFREEQKPRLPKEWIFSENEYHDAYNETDLASYNEKTQEYYRTRKYQQKEDLNWTKASKAMVSGKDDGGLLVNYIKEQGFKLN